MSDHRGSNTVLGGVPSFLAVPDRSGRRPGVVVVHDALGMTADLRRHAEWLARNGYVAAAPDLYHRGRRVRCMLQAMRALQTGRGTTFEDIEAVRRSVAEREDCTGRVGVMGFCMGGGYALALAPTGRYHAASANYGVADDRVLSQLAGACPVVASYGGRDRLLRGAAEKLERILSEHGVPHDVLEYPDAGHGFLNDHASSEVPRWAAIAGRYSSTAYHEPSAVDARRRILAFFDQYLQV